MVIDAKKVMELREKTDAPMMECKRALTETGGDMEKAILLLRQKGISAGEKRAGKVALEGRLASAISDDHRKGVLLELNCETSFVARTDDFAALAQFLACKVLAEPHYVNPDLLKADQEVQDKLNDTLVKLRENIQIGPYVLYEVPDTDYGYIDAYIHANQTDGAIVELACENAAVAAHPATAAIARELAMQITALKAVYVSREEVPEEVIEREKEVYRQRAKEEGKPEAAREKITAGRLEKFFETNVLLDQLDMREQKRRVSELVEEAAKAAGGKISVVRFTRMKVGERS